MIGVGDKVVCVDNSMMRPLSEMELSSGVVIPECGPVYTVREVFSCPYTSIASLRLVEIANPVIDYTGFGWIEPYFSISRFRPVRNIKTDISIFQQIDREIFEGVDA